MLGCGADRGHSSSSWLWWSSWNSTAFSGVEHVDVPFPLRGGRQGSRHGQGSTASSSHSHSAADVFYMVFSYFSRPKNARLGPYSGSELSADFAPSTPAARVDVGSDDSGPTMWCDEDGNLLCSGRAVVGRSRVTGWPVVAFSSWGVFCPLCNDRCWGGVQLSSSPSPCVRSRWLSVWVLPVVLRIGFFGRCFNSLGRSSSTSSNSGNNGNNGNSNDNSNSNDNDNYNCNNNKNNTIWGGSVLTGEEPPLHSGELKRALSQAGGPTQSQLSRPMSSRHHISMEHRLRRKQLNSDTDASNENI